MAAYYRRLKDRPSIKATWPPARFENPEGMEYIKNCWDDCTACCSNCCRTGSQSKKVVYCRWVCAGEMWNVKKVIVHWKKNPIKDFSWSICKVLIFTDVLKAHLKMTLQDNDQILAFAPSAAAVNHNLAWRQQHFNACLSCTSCAAANYSLLCSTFSLSFHPLAATFSCCTLGPTRKLSLKKCYNSRWILCCSLWAA